MVRQKWTEAQQVLESLNQSYPNHPDVLIHLVNVCLELHDMPAYTRACEQLRKADPKNSDAAYALAGGYLSGLHPLLALQAFHHALDRFPHHEKAQGARKLVADLEVQMEKTLEEMDLSGEDGQTIALLHEQGQAYLERGDYPQARQAEEEVLRLKPDFLSAYNNLCLISYAEGNLDQAITIAQQVLQQQPDNIHALSNLTRFCYLNGELEQAQQYGEQLKASQAAGWDPWTKKAEALSYLGDDAGVLQVFEQAKTASDLSITGAMFFHLVGVAMERSGQTKAARKQWQRALERSPGFALAQANLNDLKRPVGQRHAPWAFGLSEWINRAELQGLTTIIQSIAKSDESDDDARLTQATQRFLRQHPRIAQLIPTLLDRGDPVGREFAFRFASIAKTPETLAALRDFALSQAGPDELRHQAAMKATDAGLLPTEKVLMWLKGQQQEIGLITYEFHDDPPRQHSHQVENWLKQAISLLHQRDAKAAEQAEQLLKQALEAEPNMPDLWNNLARAYEIQERTEESQALMHQIVEQYPDYVYARASVAKLQIRRGELEAAEALLKPMVSWKRFHIADFGAFSSAYIELLIAQNHTEAAEIWLQMWEGLDPDHPELMDWKTRLAGPSLLKKLSKLGQWRSP